MKSNNHQFGSSFEAIFYSVVIVGIMWLVYWAEQLFTYKFHELGVLPRTIEGLKGLIFMPWIHAKSDVNHIINNSFPTLVLSAAIIYFYRDIALKVLLWLWVGTGFLVWIYAENKGAFHIGMSGVIYGMLGFLFTSGVLRKYLPLQAISLFVVFVYGNMIWGIFPIKAHVSWEGHFMGLFLGLILAVVYRNKSVQRPKYQYEIEKEMGIEPPDLEAIYNERVRLAELKEQEKERMEQGYFISYQYIPKKEESKSQDENDQQ